MTVSARLLPWRRKKSVRSRMTATDATDSAARAYSTHSAPARVNSWKRAWVIVMAFVSIAAPASPRGGLGFLGTLGSNAPFLGLFGTVVGIIKAFADLGVGTAKGAGASAVMSGLSEALVATAVGIFVAIPAVVAFNAFNRELKAAVGRAEAIAHALAAHLERDEVRAAARCAGTTRPSPVPAADAA